MKRYRHFTTIILLLFVLASFGQQKYEREHRIKKNQFPEKAHVFIAEYLKKARKIRYYRETDSSNITYEAKFKVDRLHYSVEFNQSGDLEDVEILIKEVDIPNDSYSLIEQFLDSTYSKYRIRRIQQQYRVEKGVPVEQILKEAFQNLLLPSIRYEIMVAGRKDNGFEDFEILFDSDGKFIEMRKSLPANYDHILY
ncbi:MAG: hypothetical protein WBM43_08200 [Flavobacteriaceae bacterium]